MKKRYSVDGKIYDIPDHLSDSFLSDNPKAVEVKNYNVDGKEYNIPLTDTADFEKDFNIQSTPVAEKKNDVSPTLPTGSNTSVEQPKPVQPPTAIDLAKQSDELSKKTIRPDNKTPMTGGVDIPDPEATAQSQKIDEGIKAQGYDPKQLKQLFGDVPAAWYNMPNFTKEKLLQGLKDNPQATERYIAATKYQNLMQPLATTDADKNTLLNSGNDVNYVDKRRDNAYLVDMATHNSVLSDDEKKKLVDNIAADRSFTYGQAAADPAVLRADPLSKNLDANQIAAYHYIKDIYPEQADGYAAGFIDPKDIKDNQEATIGREEKLKKLEEIGIGLKTNYAKEKLNPINNEYTSLLNLSKQRPLTQDEGNRAKYLVEQGAPLFNTIQQGQDEGNNLLIKYPNAGYLEADSEAQELLGQQHGFLAHTALEAGKATGNTINGVVNFIKEPFLSDKQSQINQAEILGDSKLNEHSTNLTQGNEVIQTFKSTIGKYLQADIDAIKNNDSLRYDEKRKQVDALLMTRPGEWQRTPIEGGKSNIGITSLMYGVGDLAANLAPFVVAEGLTGGGATASTARKFTSLFTSAAATSFQDAYAKAIDDGEPNPYAEAARVTAINALAMAGADAPDAIRKLAGTQKTAIGDMISKLTDTEILSALRSEPEAFSSLKKAYNIGNKVSSSIGESTKVAGKVTAFTTGGQVVNDIVDGKLKAPEDYAKQAAVSALNFAIFGTATGLAGKVNDKVNDVNKAALYTAGQDPQSFIEATDQKLKNGSISLPDATQIKDNIAKAAEVFKKVPFVDGTGKPLSEQGRRDLMFLKMQENDIETHISKDLPEQLQVTMEKRLADTQDKIDKVYKGTFIDDIAGQKAKEINTKLDASIEPSNNNESKVEAKSPVTEPAIETIPDKTPVTDKRKLLDLLNKENENAEPIIADDGAENDRAVQHLTAKDNPEQEPGIKTVEGQAESSDKTTLNKVIQDSDNLIRKATGVENVPVSDLATDEDSFQNREGLNESKVKSIVDNYNPSAFDPIQYWTDKSGQKYTLNHHRFEAIKRMGMSDIPARPLTYGKGHPKAGEIVPSSDKAEAIKFAKEESNANRSMETPLERARLLKEKRDRGDKDVKSFLEKEGRNKTFVENLSHLNPKGKTIEALKQFDQTPDKQTQKETEKIADWTGEARKLNPNLSDSHENEMFDYLKSDNPITNKNEFVEKVGKASFGLRGDESLNLKKVVDKSDNRIEWENTRDQLSKDVKNLKTLVSPDKITGWTGLKKDYVTKLSSRLNGDGEKALEEFKKPENQKIYNENLDKNKSLLQSASDKLALHLSKENDLIQGDKSQQSLFNEPAQIYTSKESDQQKIPYQSFAPNDYPTGTRDIQGENNKTSDFSTTVRGIWSKTKDLQFSGKPVVKNHADVAHIMRLLENKSVEHAFAVHIDKDGKVFIQFLSVGSRTGTFVDAKNVLAGARKHNAVETYLVHNHPSGNLTPSEADIQLTNKMRAGLGGLGIRVQHIIMDTYKGEYTLIGPRGDIKQFSRDQSETSNIKITAEKFDTFEALTKPLSQPIRDVDDVAKIIHQSRFSALPKRAVLLLNAANEIISNNLIKKHIDAVDLVANTPTATSVIFYGNEWNIDSVLTAQRALLNFDIPVFDYVIRNSSGKDIADAYSSAAESGLLNEIQSKYGTNSVGEVDKPLDEKTQLANNIIGEHIKNGVKDLEEILDTDAKELGLKSSNDLPDSYRKLIEQTYNEEQEVIKAKLNKAEENVAKREIPSALAKSIVDHENLTIENIEAVKQLFQGFPYTKEDYQNIKTYLNENRSSNTESDATGQSTPGDAENKTTGDPGEALQPETKDTETTSGEDGAGDVQSEGESKANTFGAIEKVDKSFDEKVDDFADKLIKKLSIRNANNLTKQGAGIKEIVKAGAEIIKAAYHAGTDIKQAIEDAIDYIRTNWDSKFGPFDKGAEKDVRDLLDNMGFNEEGLKSIETNRDNKSIERQVKKAMDESASPKDMADLKAKLATKYNRTPEEINSIAHAKDIKHVQDLLGDKTDEHLMNMLQRKGFAPHEAIDILGEAKRNVLPLEERERIVTDAAKEGNKLIDAWIGDRNVTKKSAEVKGDNLHKEIEKTIPKMKLTESKFHFTKRRQIVEAALDFHHETRGMSADEITAKMEKVDKATHAKEWSIYEQSKNLTPEQIAVADKMQAWQKEIEQEALKGGVIKQAIENYTTHDWDLSQQKGNGGKFSTSTSHSKERALFTMMDGWAEGLHLKSYGGANKLVRLQQEISGVVQNRSLIEEGLRTKSADGLPVFSIKKLDGYSKIDNPAFKIFKGSPFDVYAPDKVARGLNNILKRSALYDLPGIETITKVNAGIKTTILATGLFHANTFMRVLYLTTPKLLQLQNPVKVYRDGIKAAREMTPAVIDGLQHGLTLGTMHDGDEFYDSKNKDPQIAAKLTKLQAVIDKLPSIPQPVKDRLSFEVARQHKWLFGQIMTGLKTNQYIKYREVLAKKFPNLDPSELSRAAAKAINTQYGGNNLELSRRNPTLQHALKLAVLAPDWLESAWGRYTGTLKGGAEGYLYRRMAANTLIRGAALVTLSNMALALMSDDKKPGEPEDWWGRFTSRLAQAHKNGNLDVSEVDITPLYHSLGGTKDHAYFSVFGVTSEPLKVLTGIPGSIGSFTGDEKSKDNINYNRGGEGNLLTYLSSKFSPTSRFLKESLTSQNWQGMEFTSLPELGGYDDKGEYARTQKAHNKGDISPTTGKPYVSNKKGHAKGDEKGGQLEGKFVTWPIGSAHPLHATQIPSFIGNEIMASTPTQIQNAFWLQQGQSDWFTMIANSIGVGLRVGKDK